MCRLFGFRSNVPSGAHRSLVEAENALADQACRHQDGWGIGYYLGEDAYILKSHVGAAGDESFRRVTSRLQSHTFVVHVRNATVGATDYLNSHPFRHGAWMFAHDGTLFGFEGYRDRLLEATLPGLRGLIFGSTDSEHLFYYLISAMCRVGAPENGRGCFDTDSAARALSDALSRVYQWARAESQPPPLANYILTNGRTFFAQQGGIELFLATQKRSCRDFETCPEPRKVCMEVRRPIGLVRGRRPPDAPYRAVNHLLVASEPIGDEDIWETIPEGMLVVLNDALELFLRPGPADFEKCPTPPAPPPLDLRGRHVSC